MEANAYDIDDGDKCRRRRRSRRRRQEEKDGFKKKNKDEKQYRGKKINRTREVGKRREK